MWYYTLLPLCLLSLTVSALPSSARSSGPVGYLTFPLTRSILPRTDALRSRQTQPITTALYNDVFSYYFNVTVGTPPQTFKLILDTGSSDIFVFSSDVAKSCPTCSDKYFNVAASSSLSKLPGLGVFNITYLDQSGAQGYYASDIIGVGGTSVRQTIGVATVGKGSGFENGIFGIGLDENESIVGRTGKPYLGYLSSLKAQNLIKTRAYSIYLNSRFATDKATGELIIGGYDSSKWTGNLVPFPMILPTPSGRFELDLLEPKLSFSLGSGTASVAAVSNKYTVLLDTGTTKSYIPSAQFVTIATAVGAQLSASGTQYTVDCTLALKSGGVNFDFDGPYGKVTITVPWIELVTPSSTLPTGRCSFGLAPQSESVARGVYILGDSFLRSAYVLFNYDASTISLAQIRYNHQKRSQIMAL